MPSPVPDSVTASAPRSLMRPRTYGGTAPLCALPPSPEILMVVLWSLYRHEFGWRMFTHPTDRRFDNTNQDGAPGSHHPDFLLLPSFKSHAEHAALIRDCIVDYSPEHFVLAKSTGPTAEEDDQTTCYLQEGWGKFNSINWICLSADLRCPIGLTNIRSRKYHNKLRR